MCIKTDHIPVLTLKDFRISHDGFLMMPLDQSFRFFKNLKGYHRQLYYTILFCRRGMGRVRADKQDITLNKDSVVCVGPNSVNSYELENITDGWMIIFTDSFFSMRYNDNVLYNFDCLRYNNLCHQELSEDNMKEWAFYMKLMDREARIDSKASKSMLRSYMNILLSILSRSSAIRADAYGIKTEKDYKLLNFEKLIEENFRQYKRPSFYAEQLCITVNYLNKICREKRGISSGEIIRARVALESERLLAHTGMTVSEIAHALGYDAVSYFSSFFKKGTGFSPEQYRKQHQE